MLNGLLWKRTEIILSFLRLHPSTVFQTLVDYEGYSISSKGFLPLDSPILVHFSSLIPKMSVFTFAISCLTTSNLLWFMDLTFQVPMQHCSLQHQTWLSPPDTSTAERGFRFVTAASFSLELVVIALHFFAIAYWIPPDLWGSSGVIYFCLFIGFSRQEYWSVLPFPSPVAHVLSELFTMTVLGGPAWHSS